MNKKIQKESSEVDLEEVELKNVDFEPYKKITPNIYKQVLSEVKEIKKKKIIHVNSTEKGGGVAEMLHTLVPMQRSLGFDARWFVMHALPDFYEATKKIHNALQGNPESLSPEEREVYISTTNELGSKFKKILEDSEPATIIIHDPQPLPFIEKIPEKHSVVLRLHIDLSTPNPVTLNFLRPFIEQYPLVMISNILYRPIWLPEEKTRIVFPAIDPFTEKNRRMKPEVAEKILANFNIHTDRPIITQVSRFDPWKDPLGVIEAFYKAKNEIPNLQLVLAGFFAAKDDPEAIRMFEKVKKYAKGDININLFEDLSKLKEITNDTFINALQTASTVVMQKSLREGFGLTVTEAMWKEKAVIGGSTTGISTQIEHGVNGIIVSSVNKAGKAITALVKNEEMRERLGKEAKKTVKERFLMSRLMLDHFKTYKNLEK